MKQRINDGRGRQALQPKQRDTRLGSSETGPCPWFADKRPSSARWPAQANMQQEEGRTKWRAHGGGVEVIDLMRAVLLRGHRVCPAWAVMTQATPWAPGATARSGSRRLAGRLAAAAPGVLVADRREGGRAVPRGSRRRRCAWLYYYYII